MKKIIFYFLFSILAFSFEIEIDINYQNNLDYGLDYIDFKKGKTQGEKGYINFLKIVNDFDENKRMFNFKLNNLESKRDVKFNLEVELYQSFSDHLKRKNRIYPIVDFYKLDQNTPYKGLIYYKNMRIGRGELNWGPGKYGNLLISDYSKYFDYFSFDYDYKKIKFNYVLSTLNPYLDEEEYKIQSEYDYDEVKNNERLKLLVGHRIDYNATEKLKLSISEIHIVGGKYPEINHLSPLAAFHNSYTDDYSNVMFGFDVEYNKKEDYNIYFSMVIDDWSIKGEDEDLNPNAVGILTGIEKNINKYKINFEYTRTSKWLYNRDEEYLKFTNRRIIRSDYGEFEGKYVVDYPIGFYLGPDAEVYNIGISMGNKYLVFRRVRKGEKNLQSDYAEAKHENWDKLTGIIEIRNELELGISMVHFYAKGYFADIDNYGHEDGVQEGEYKFVLGYRKVFKY